MSQQFGLVSKTQKEALKKFTAMPFIFHVNEGFFYCICNLFYPMIMELTMVAEKMVFMTVICHQTKRD